MKKGSETAKIYEAYKSLFSLPSKKKILAINLIQIVLFSSALWLIGISDMITLILIPVYYFLYVLIIKMLVFRRRTTLDLRRSLGLNAITNGVSFILFFVGLMIRNISIAGYHFLALVSVGFVAVITIMVVYTNAEIALYKSILVAFSIVVILDLIQNKISYASITINYLYLLVQLIIYGLTSIAIIFIPMRLASAVGNFSGVELTRGFIFAWVLKEPTLLENVLKKFSLKRRVPMGFIRYKKINSGEELFVIISNIHPGPFLNVGSSNLPYLVNQWFRYNVGCDAIMLHGTCTHSENLPTKDEVERLIIRLNCIRSNISLRDFKGTIIKRKHGDLTYIWQIINNNVFLSVSKSPKPMDDFHVDVGLLYRELMRTRGLDGLIIDSHNSLKEPSAMPLIRPEDEEAKQIIMETKRFLDEYDRIEFSTNVRVGWANVKCDLIDVEDGLGPGGVWAIYHDYGGKEFLSIVIDSNNLGNMVREKIIEELSGNKYGSDIEVFTTDTHIVNAVKPGSGGYRLLQLDHLEKLMPYIKKAIERAKETVSDAKVGVLISEIDALMLGEENITRLLLASLVGSKAFKLSLITISILAAISLLFFSFLL